MNPICKMCQFNASYLLLIINDKSTANGIEMVNECGLQYRDVMQKETCVDFKSVEKAK